MESEGAARVSALSTQLELANVQRAEFEEAVERLKQELRDAAEDKKILEKKGKAEESVPDTDPDPCGSVLIWHPESGSGSVLVCIS